jgi:flagellar motor switch protein FliN/FliY
VNQPNASVASLLDVFASELQAQLSQGHSKNITVSWRGGREDQTPSELIWWSWSLSIDSASRILVGAPLETWRGICGLSDDAYPDDLRDECLARFTPAVEQTARSRFGSEVTCPEVERSDAPPYGWTTVPLTVAHESSPDVSVHFGVSPDLEKALGIPVNDSEPSQEKDLVPQAMAVTNSADILMHVEMPVSISLGRTKMRMKDLFHLTNGSVVELDQELGDEVEIRVNNCIIAYGEVVAVDGNYAVRILRMAPARNTPGLRGALPERAA